MIKIDLTNRITPVWIDKLPLTEIVAVASNLEGRHGRGGAKTAVQKWGAIYGQAVGLQGKTYMIPTKDGRRGIDPKVKITLPVEAIKPYVDEFIQFVIDHPAYTAVNVLKIGCGNATHTPETMAPLFRAAIPVTRIRLPQEFWDVLLKKIK